MLVTRNVTYVVRIVCTYIFKAPVCVFDNKGWVEDAKEERLIERWNGEKDGVERFWCLLCKVYLEHNNSTMAEGLFGP